MNKSLKKKWVKALRSGDYRQGIGALRKGKSGDLFCCLGVLCDIVQDKKDDNLRWYKVGAGKRAEWFFGAGQNQLPGEARAQAGITGGEQTTLIGLNDESKLSFKAIADYIEENL